MHVDGERQYTREEKREWWVAQKEPKGIFRINICSEVAGKKSLRIPHPSFGPKANTMRASDERSLDSNAGSPIREVCLSHYHVSCRRPPKESQPHLQKTTAPITGWPC